jgi:hypothetical protein
MLDMSINYRSQSQNESRGIEIIKMNNADDFHADILRRNFMTLVVQHLEKIANAMERQASALERLTDQWQQTNE